jgi:hypothetical protein
LPLLILFLLAGAAIAFVVNVIVGDDAGWAGVVVGTGAFFGGWMLFMRRFANRNAKTLLARRRLPQALPRESPQKTVSLVPHAPMPSDT